MDDVLKIGLGAISGAVGGFIVGVFTEPIKLQFQQRSKLHQMETALYREMASNFESLLEHLKTQLTLKEGHNIYVHDIQKKDDVLQRTKQEYLYAQIHNLRNIEIFYRRFASLKGKGEKPEHWRAAREVLNSINETLKRRSLRKSIYCLICTLLIKSG